MNAPVKHVRVNNFKNKYRELPELRDKCLRCWASEYSDIFPQKHNRIIASAELRRHGNPECKCDNRETGE